MLRKTIGCILSVFMICSFFGIETNAQIEFPDLNSSHWAYPAVSTLVADGTVKGFEDGEFKPDKTVSRAEFVKMMGKGAKKREKDYLDVNSTHWAYEYIMYSELAGNNNIFSPDTAITREDCITAIWRRNGSSTGSVVPSVMTSQGSNADAIAWAYSHGILIGDDGLDLRLGDSLSRAEAAVLIVRARDLKEGAPLYNFVDTVSEEILERIFEDMYLFDNSEYESNKTITNGELARAALRLGAEKFELLYDKKYPDTLFAHEYSRELYVVAKECLGEEYVNEDFIDKSATIQDVLIAFTYNMIKKSKEPVVYGKTGSYYADMAKPELPIRDVCATYCFQNGVRLYSDLNINPDKTATHKEIACILLQLDYLIGANSEITTDSKNGNRVAYNSKIRKSKNTYPENYADYAFIMENVPNEVYIKPFADNSIGARPKDSYDFCREYGSIFVNMLTEFKNRCEAKSNAKISFTFYPSLVCKNNNGATLRVKCEILENKNNASLSDIFQNGIETENLPQAAEGLTFYADIITGQPVNDIILSSDKMVVKQLVYTEN